MGCYWSSEGSGPKCTECRSRVFMEGTREKVCRRCRQPAWKNNYQVSSSSNDAMYGEYRCPSCKRTWASRLSRKGKLQFCKKCHVGAFPMNMRRLNASDRRGGDKNRLEHQSKLCQMCQELGHYCGKRGY